MERKRAAPSTAALACSQQAITFSTINVLFSPFLSYIFCNMHRRVSRLTCPARNITDLLRKFQSSLFAEHLHPLCTTSVRTSDLCFWTNGTVSIFLGTSVYHLHLRSSVLVAEIPSTDPAGHFIRPQNLPVIPERKACFGFGTASTWSFLENACALITSECVCIQS